MKNTINISSTIDAIYALSSLKNIIKDPTLPGPIGRDEEEGLRIIVLQQFADICAEIDHDAEGESVELPCDCRELLQSIVTDRTIAELTLRNPRSDLMRRLRCRLRPRPPKTACRY